MTIETLTVAGAFDDENDLFTRPPRAVARQQAKQAHITCRVCDRPATVPLDHPALLCNECLENLDQTRIHVQKWLASVLAGLDEAKATFDELVMRSPAAARWQAVQAALIGVAEKRVEQHVFDATWQKRKAEGGPLAQLLLAYEGYAQECDRLGEELDRLDKAQTEINAAWLQTEL